MLQQSLQENHEIRSKRREALAAIQRQIDEDRFIQSVLADGNCLFRALARAFNQVHGTAIEHLQVRAACVNEVINNPALSSRFARSDDQQAYIDHMTKPGSYCDELCIRAFCSAYKTQVLIFILITNLCSSAMILPPWGDHYDAILLRRLPSICPIPQGPPLNQQPTLCSSALCDIPSQPCVQKLRLQIFALLVLIN